jgi:pimeloyl-ACP methyl ester carboxylesterase
MAPPSYRGGSGEPLVLLHGFTNDWQSWKPVLPALAAGFSVFAPTLPGHFGAERWPLETPLSIAAMTDALERQLDREGIGSAHLVGNSLGGWLGFELAARGRALSVTGLCPAGGWEYGSKEERATYLFFWRSSRIAIPLSKRFFRALATRPRLRRIAMRDVVTHPDRMDAALALSTMEAAAGCGIALQLLALSKQGELFGELGAIEGPVTIATSAGDRLFSGPDYFCKFRRLLPDAEWVDLEGLGHLPMSDDPERVVEVIRAGTGRVASPPSFGG